MTSGPAARFEPSGDANACMALHDDAALPQADTQQQPGELAQNLERSGSHAHAAPSRSDDATPPVSPDAAERADPADAPLRRRPYSYMLVIAYDGTEFNGYQLQNGRKRELRTVQGVLARALATRLQESTTSLRLLVRKPPLPALVMKCASSVFSPTQIVSMP
jgi:hypothetical protein